MKSNCCPRLTLAITTKDFSKFCAINFWTLLPSSVLYTLCARLGGSGCRDGSLLSGLALTLHKKRTNLPNHVNVFIHSFIYSLNNIGFIIYHVSDVLLLDTTDTILNKTDKNPCLCGDSMITCVYV